MTSFKGNAGDRGSQPEHDRHRLAAVGVFVRTGDYWTVGSADANFTLKDIKGFHYIERLLRHPGEEFHVLDLVSEPVVDSNSQIDTPSDPALSISRLGDSGEILDARAKQDYKRRLRELREEFEELRGCGAYERAAKVESEIDFLEREIAYAVGLGGRSRRAGSAAERARLNVTRLIRTAIQKISEHDHTLGESFDRSIRTGSFCSYFPDPRIPISWRFSLEEAAEGTAHADKIRSPAPLIQRNDRYFQGTFVSRTAFVGRDTEQATLRLYLDQLLRGAGAIVVVAGAAGVGKTRLVTEFSREASKRGVLTLAGACYDREDPVPFVPFVEMLETLLAVSSSADIREVLGEDIGEIARLLPQLHRLFPDIPPPLELPPEQSRRVLFNSFARVLGHMSTAQPVLLVLDDLHWADEETLSLITHLAPLIAKIPVLIVGTYRDFELRPDRPLAQLIDELVRRHLLEQLSLSGLPKPEVTRLIEALGGREPPEEVANLIYSATEGNPFFIEELLQYLIEQDRLLDNDGAFRQDLKLNEFDVPRNLRLVIGRRVARLSNGAQKTLATAAVIGRAFTFELLQESCRGEIDALLDWIEEAEKAGLIGSTWQHPDVQFRFSHELIRQTVAGQLSSARRQRLHLNIADAFERLYANTLQDHIDDLAHHLWEAGTAADANRISNCLVAAAKNASNRSAYEAEVRYLRNGLDAIKRLPCSPERIAEELRLQIALTGPLTATKGYTAPEVEKACSRARELSRQIKESRQLFEVTARLYSVHSNRGDLQESLQLAREMLRLAQTKQHPLLLLWAHYCLGHTFSLLGELQAGRTHTEQSLALYDFTQAREYGFIQDPGATGLARLGIILYLLGYPDQALEKALEALVHARKLSQPFTLAWVLGAVGNIHAERGEFQQAEQLWAERVALCMEHNFPSMLASGIVGQGWAMAEQGQVQKAILRIKEGFEAFPATHSKPEQLTYLLRIGYTYRRLRWSKEGLAAIIQALKLLDENETLGRADLHYLKGEMLVIEDTNSRPEAQRCFRTAIEIARSQSARTHELKAVTSLARLLVHEGCRGEAHTMLAEIYGWFTEGFDTADLKEAKALLEELAL